MKCVHYMRREKSGLAYTTLELVKAEEQQGHQVCLREPTDKEGLQGAILYGPDLVPDVEFVHSQMPFTSYFAKTPKFVYMHGEPLSSVGNGVSMKALVAMAPKVDAFLAMRPEELAVWQAIKRTYLIPKGIDLQEFRPLPAVEKLEGEPAVLYCEHWRGQRNPLYWCVAMQEVWKTLPKACLHLYNCTDAKMAATFNALLQHNKWWVFIRSLKGAVPHAEMNALYNRSDIVVSALYPLYARGLEALGAGKAFIGPGYTNPDYPWHCTVDPHSMAQAILECWTDYGRCNYRQWAEQHHDVQTTVHKVMQIVERYQ